VCCVCQDHLDAKQAPYIPVARNGCQLFEIVCHMSRLHPVYYESTTSLTRLFVEAVKSRDRGKGCGGRFYLCFASIFISDAV